MIGVALLMALGTLTLAVVAQVAGWRDALIDDAFITFRYGRNLAEGQGLVFNPGERVEGFTSLLYTLLSAWWHLFEADVPALAQHFNVLCNVALVLLTYAYARRRLKHSPYVALIAPMMLVANLNLSAWAAHGMETSLFTLLVTLGLMMVAPRDDEKRLTWDTGIAGGMVLAAATYTRPEGMLYTGLALLLQLLRAARLQKGGTSVVMLALFSLAPVAALESWRLYYYGEWLPNTFYAKATGGAGKYEAGWEYLLRFFDGSLLGGLVLVPLLVLVKRVPNGPRPLFLLVVSATVVYTVLVGGDAFQGSRFFVPILPVLYLLVQDGLNFFFRSARVVRVMTVFYVFLLGLGLVVMTGGQSARQATLAAQMTLNRAWLGRMLQVLMPAEQTLALNTVGALPYYAQRVTLDMYGLTDHHIARRPLQPGGTHETGHEKGDGAYVLSRKPDLILLRNVWLADVPIEAHRSIYGTSERELVALEGFARDYQPVNLRLRDDLLFGFYLRRDHSAEELQQRFRELSLDAFGPIADIQSERWMERALYESGLRLVQAGRQDAAVREFQRALALYPDGGEVHLAFGQSLEQLNQLDEAREHYQRATELLTESAGAWWGLGNVEAKQEKGGAAIRAYQKAVLADPNLVDAYANMASLLLKEGRNTEALPILKTAVSKAPRDLELWLKLGVAAASSLRWSDAQEALERVRGLAPTDVKTLEYEAWLNKRLPPELKGSNSLP